jgi:hypothetical protein
MPKESIVFSPEVSERQLKNEVGQIDDQLASVGEDVPVSFDEEELDSLSPPSAGGGLAAAGGGGGGAGAGAGAAAGLAGKLPKPVAGVTAASALPIALAGGVGLGLLSAMQSASARLQTDTKLLGIAVDNFFREPGNILSEHITRPIVEEFLSFSLDFDDALRSNQFADAGRMLAEASYDLNQITNPVMWPSLVIERVGAVVLDAFNELDFRGIITDAWPGWPSVRDDWLGWPSVRQEWLGWPDIQPVRLPAYVTGVNLGSFVTGLNLGNYIDIPDILQRDTADLGGPPPTGGGTPDQGRDKTSTPPRRGGFRADERADRVSSGSPIVGLQTGGRITESGVAKVDRGELVTDERRLVSMLADAINTNTGNGAGGGETGAIETKLDQLNRTMTRLASEMQRMELRTDSETIGRVASKGKRQGLGGRDPTV